MNLPGSLKWRRFFLTASLLLVCQPAFAEKRVALVLGPFEGGGGNVQICN